MFLFRKIEPIMLVTLIPTLLSTMVVLAIFIFLLIDSYPVFISMGLDFLIGREWYPIEGIYGAFPMIYGSLTVTILSLIFSLPLAIGSAIFVSEFLSEKWRVWIKGCMELLAGIPSIVYGLIGITMLSELVKSTLALGDGSCILTASILLGIMILPTIMTVSEDAIHNVPEEYREASLGLGLTRTEMVVNVVLPLAKPGVLSSILLGIGRAIGETMAVMLVIGSIDRLPNPFYNILLPAQTITSKLGREAAESLGSGLHWNALVGLGLLLFVIVAGIIIVSTAISNTWKRWI
jgi:phosphate transport system permease protein